MKPRYLTVDEMVRRAENQEAPNLDAMTAADLKLFFHDYRQASREVAVARLGNRPGAQKALQLLARYAWNKAAAMEARLTGKMRDALTYERLCDDLYDQLPDFARW